MRTPWLFMLLAGGALLAGCASQEPAPIEGKLSSSAPARPQRPPLVRAPRPPSTTPDTYRIVRGDTLYSIAFRFGLDPRQIALWNGLENPNRILVGQQLRLTPTQAAAPRKMAPPGAAAASVPASPAAPPTTVTAAPPVANPVPPASTPPPTTPTPDAVIGGTRSVSGLAWTWPASGKMRRAIAVSGSEGLEILGQRGQPVLAAATGQVVYSGNGLRGYGQLIIIKHNDTFLSAYAHNDKLLVNEGTRVNAGQQIAQMGDSEASEVMLHFEIRKNGKAVGPLQFLPQR